MAIWIASWRKSPNALAYRSEVVRDAVRRQLALEQFRDLRRRVMPLAEARGYVTDEDVFRDIS